MSSSLRSLLVGAAMLAMANGQGVILSAKGDKGTSLGLLVDSNNQNDANFISDTEINANVVNECGRTLAAGNIDIGENTENALAAGNVTQVTKGSKVQITLDQRNANGTGPFACDLDPTSNANGLTGQTALNTANGNAQSATGQMTLTVTLPSDLACTGASTGNVCTVRCRNAQDFGGCIAVQQTDVTPSKNDPAKITSAQTLSGIQAQIQQNKIDLAAAVAGNQAATQVTDQGVDIAQAILDADPAIGASVQKELATNAVSTAAAAATTAANTNTNNGNGKKGKGNGNTANANGNAAKGNGNAANAATGNGNGNGNGNNANGNAGNANAATGNGNAANANANANAGNGNANAATGNGNGRGNANAGNANAATGNGNNANTNAGNGANANNAAAGGGGATGGRGNNANAGNNNNNNNNNKRESLAERRKRFVQAGVDYTPADGN